MEAWVWMLAKKFGWTLEYIESLPLARWHEFEAVKDGYQKAAADLRGRGINIEPL